MNEELKNSMQAIYNIEAVDIPSQLFIKLEGELVALTSYVKISNELVEIKPQWK